VVGYGRYRVRRAARDGKGDGGAVHGTMLPSQDMTRPGWVLIAVAACKTEDVATKVHHDRDGGTKLQVSVAVPATSSDLPHLLPHGGLSFELLDDATGQRMPGKLTLIGARGAMDP